jgi:hypothetical protein
MPASTGHASVERLFRHWKTWMGHRDHRRSTRHCGPITAADVAAVAESR